MWRCLLTFRIKVTVSVPLVQQVTEITDQVESEVLLRRVFRVESLTSAIVGKPCSPPRQQLADGGSLRGGACQKEVRSVGCALEGCPVLGSWPLFPLFADHPKVSSPAPPHSSSIIFCLTTDPKNNGGKRPCTKTPETLSLNHCFLLRVVYLEYFFTAAETYLTHRLNQPFISLYTCSIYMYM